MYFMGLLRFFFCFLSFSSVADRVFSSADDRLVLLTEGRECTMGSLFGQRLAHGIITSTSHNFCQNGYQHRVYNDYNLLHRVFKAFKEEKWRLYGNTQTQFTIVPMVSLYLTLSLLT